MPPSCIATTSSPSSRAEASTVVMGSTVEQMDARALPMSSTERYSSVTASAVGISPSATVSSLPGCPIGRNPWAGS